MGLGQHCCKHPQGCKCHAIQKHDCKEYGRQRHVCTETQPNGNHQTSCIETTKSACYHLAQDILPHRCGGYHNIVKAKANSTSDYVVANRDGDPLSYTQFKRLWQYIVTRTIKERSYYRYENGNRVKHTVTPVLGEKAAHNGKVVYSLDFEVTPHQLRHTYITNLIYSSVDPKTVQYLAGHESSRITMDIYAKVKYNRPDQLVKAMSGAFAQWDTQ